MFKFWDIRKNILSLVLAPAVLITISLSLYFIHERISILEKAHLDKGKTIISSLSLISESILADNKELLQKKMNAFRDIDKDVLAIAMLTDENEVIAKAGNNSYLEILQTVMPDKLEMHIFEKHLHIVQPVSMAGSPRTHYLSLLTDRSSLLLDTYQIIMIRGSISALVIILSIMIALHLNKKISKPLVKISNELESINNGMFDIDIHTPDIPELATISNTIKKLATSLLEANENIQHNVNQATADLTQTLETIEIQNIELDMARKQAIQASRVKSEFLANISHEIRTPMNGVIGFTNLLLNSNIDKTQKDYLLTIRKSANNLLSIIEDILDFSKIEAGKMSIDKATYSLHDCVEEVISMIAASSSKKNIELIPLIYKDVPEQLFGDAIRVKQILTNLISNAIKFTENGSIVVRIVLEQEHDEYQVIRTTITDTGIGMTDEQLEKLFQPFSQVNHNINRHHSGTGLGLVICKKLVEQMGGEITVESKSNEGTSFSYTLISEKVHEATITKPIPQLVSLPDQPVYIYDPHPMALLAMKHMLSNWNMKTFDFQSLNKLEQVLQEKNKEAGHKPIVMLGITGESRYLSSIRRIMNNEIAGLVLLGHTAESDGVAEFLNQDNAYYLEKPLTRKQLVKSFEDIGIIESTKHKVSENKGANKQFSRLRILAVDDNPANLKLITIVLEEMAIDVTKTYDGLSAIEICKEKKFDLIFMDIRMPVLDGIETSNRIRTAGANKRTPIVALTAHAMANERERLLSLKLDDCITKPISTTQLEQVISKWTGQVAEHVDVNNNSRPHPIHSGSIDWNACLNITGGREKLAREMLNDLVTAIPKFLKQLEKMSNDNSELLSVVHKLHGLACYTGVPTIQALASELESKIKSRATPKTIKKLQSSLIEALSKVEQDSVSFLV